MVLNSHVDGLQKKVKVSLNQDLRFLKVDRVLKIDATIHSSLDLCVHNI